jgi:predicted nuclease of predicted toxin-antitoxin system
VRFLLDRCAARRLGDWLRGQGHDAEDVGARGEDPGDEVILGWAVTEQRVLVTMDKDFGHFVFVLGKLHCGIVRLPHVRSAEQIALMSEVLDRHGADLERGAIVTVRGGRMRISRSR